MRYLVLYAIARAIRAAGIHCCLTDFPLTFQNYVAVTVGVKRWIDGEIKSSIWSLKRNLKQLPTQNIIW
jgi:hypothetical protein